MTDNKYTGVIWGGDDSDLNYLKPLFSVFDRIAVMKVSGIPVPDPNEFRPFSVFHKTRYQEVAIPEILLKDRLILPVDFGVEHGYGKYVKVPVHVEEFFLQILDPSDVKNTLYDDIKLDIKKILLEFLLTLKIGALYLQHIKKIQAVPVMDITGFTTGFLSEKKAGIVNIILSDYPVFEETVPWEAIIEFSKDDDAIENKLAMRRWITKISNEKYSEAEIKEEIAFLINQRKKYLDYHRAKYKNAVSEAWIKLPLVMAEDLLKGRLGKLVDNLLHVRHSRAALLEAELNAPHPEIAQCLKMQEVIAKTRGR